MSLHTSFFKYHSIMEFNEHSSSPNTPYLSAAISV